MTDEQLDKPFSLSEINQAALSLSALVDTCLLYTSQLKGTNDEIRQSAVISIDSKYLLQEPAGRCIRIFLDEEHHIHCAPYQACLLYTSSLFGRGIGAFARWPADTSPARRPPCLPHRLRMPPCAVACSDRPAGCSPYPADFDLQHQASRPSAEARRFVHP